MELEAALSVYTHPVGQFTTTTRSPYPLSMLAPGYDQQVFLEIDLDRAQVEALEAIRGGDTLSLELSVRAVLQDPKGDFQQCAENVNYSVNQSVWINVLEQMHYQRTMLLEVHVPDSQTAPELAQACHYLAQGQRALVRGAYRDAVGYCREVLEAISSALGETDGWRKMLGRQNDLSKAERLQVLRGAFKIFTHPAHHGGANAASIDWTRTDAIMAIAISAALLNELQAPGAHP